MVENLKRKILIVEDDSNTRDFLSIVFSEAGYEVIAAQDGLDGYRKAIEHRPDVAVTDVMMPIMDGVELCAVLRTQFRIPVVMISAYERPDRRPVWDAYFDKPLEIPQLLASVQQLTASDRRL